jgi:hypothetical protein
LESIGEIGGRIGNRVGMDMGTSVADREPVRQPGPDKESSRPFPRSTSV